MTTAATVAVTSACSRAAVRTAAAAAARNRASTAVSSSSAGRSRSTCNLVVAAAAARASGRTAAGVGGRARAAAPRRGGPDNLRTCGPGGVGGGRPSHNTSGIGERLPGGGGKGGGGGRRSFSAGQQQQAQAQQPPPTSHQYEYPLRTEVPVVTRSNSSDLDTTTPSDSPPKMNDVSRIPPDQLDHFDDRSTLDPTTRSSLLAKQHSDLNTALDKSHRISLEVPSAIPSNLPSSSLEIPHTEVTTLDNGLRVASQETYGQVATVGVLANVGSRHETDANTGVNHLMELLAFQSTRAHPHASEIVSRMDELGGSTFASAGREQMMYCVDILRPSVEEATELLSGTVLTPLITDEEVEEMKRVIGYQHQDVVPEVWMGEGLQIAGYPGQQLGRPHFCPKEALPHLSADMVHGFRARHFSASEMVLAGAGIEHDKLVELADRYFSSVPPTDMSLAKGKTKPSVYSGGEYRMQMQTVDGHTRVAVAFEVGGWHSDDLVPTCVLQILLGGGSSFSAGGPGKGMYSRLYREVLNRFYWAESAEAFTSFHSESGLLGISGSSVPEKSRDLTRVIAEHFAKLASEPVTDEEIDRARNMLKCNVLTQLESRLVLFEDIGRQILTYGERESSERMCERIDAVTAGDIQAVARRALSKPPTISTVGDDLSKVPTHEELAGWFGI